MNIKMINKNKTYRNKITLILLILILIKIFIVIYIVTTNNRNKKLKHEIEKIKKKIHNYKNPKIHDGNYEKYRTIKFLLLKKEIKYNAMIKNKNIPLYIREKINEINKDFLPKDVKDEIETIENKIEKKENYASHVKKLNSEYHYQKYIYDSIKLIFRLHNTKIQKKVNLKEINFKILDNLSKIKEYAKNIKINKQKYNTYSERMQNLDYLYSKVKGYPIDTNDFENYLDLDNEFQSRKHYYRTENYLTINRNLHIEYTTRSGEITTTNKNLENMINALYVQNLELFLNAFN